VKRNNGCVKCSVNNNKQKKDHKVDLLKPNFEVTGYTKPNSKVRSLINPIPEYVSKLTNKNALVFIGGSNDIDDNSTECSLNDIHHTNIILGEIPHRYARDEYSAVNQKIMTYDRKLNKYSKSNTHLDIMEAVQERKYYMNQGFHLNALDKDALCSKLRVIIDKIFMSNDVVPIPLTWKKDHPESENDIIVNDLSKVEVNKKKSIQDVSAGDYNLQVSEKYTGQA
jgi:hypothetical protein